MTVQISVTIWTILCFAAAMLILTKLLFKPMLGFMDARKENIERARAAREAAQQQHDAQEEEIREARLAAKTLSEKEASERLAAVQDRAAHTAAEKKDEYIRQLEEDRAALAEESAQIIAELTPQLDSLAALYARKLIF